MLLAAPISRPCHGATGGRPLASVEAVVSTQAEALAEYEQLPLEFVRASSFMAATLASQRLPPPTLPVGVRHRELAVFVEADGEASHYASSVATGDPNGQGVLTCRHVSKGRVGDCVKNLEGWLSFVLSQHVHEGRWVTRSGRDLD